MMLFAQIALSVAAVPVLAACSYLALLTILSKRTAPPSSPPPRSRFDVVVPAHDEAADVGATVESLLSIDYPRSLFRVVVVADNCTDDTADRARAAGADVFVRDDASRIGKGHALAFAFEKLTAEQRADAVVVVDADTVVSPNLLRAFSARIAGGATAVQASYVVGNAMTSWRTRVVAIAFAMFHELRSIGRERLGVSCGLRGNGMCFVIGLLQAVPYDAFSVVEDVEYGIKLGVAGHRVRYAQEARVCGQVASTEKNARTQRARWEGGRSRLARLWVRRLFAQALHTRDRVCLDLAFDLLVPPIATSLAAVAVGLVLSIALSSSAGHALAPLWLFSACAVALAVHGLRGWQLSGTGLRGLLDVIYVPGFVAWKLALRLRRSWRTEEWIRSPRERNAP